MPEKYYKIMIEIGEVYREWNIMGGLSDKDGFNKIKEIIEREVIKNGSSK